MKPQIRYRAMQMDDYGVFIGATSYYPGPQFNGIVAYFKRDHREHIMGMVGFDGWTPRTVTAHWAIRYPRCIQPLWFECVSYIAQTGRRAILGATPSDNVKALKAIRHLGWIELYRIKDAWDEGVDIVISEYPIHVNAAAFTGRVRGRADSDAALMAHAGLSTSGRGQRRASPA